jgi:SAM-dependent methyltransferase
MDYRLQQGGRARIAFLGDVRRLSDKLEPRADKLAFPSGIDEESLPDDPAALQARIAPALEAIPAFRILRLCRDWTLEQHGRIAISAFEEIRPTIEPELRARQTAPHAISYARQPRRPDYWEGYEFHKSTGGWDGHPYMGFIHGELIHRQMVNPAFAGLIYASRKSVAASVAERNVHKILELGCCSGQYTLGLSEVFPQADIWACDLSARQLEQAQRVANERKLGWNLFQADAEHTGCADAEFDLVTSFAMLHELPRSTTLKVLRECLRVTRPGGVTVLGDIKAYSGYSRYERWRNDYWNQLHGGDPHWREHAAADLAELALTAGFASATYRGLLPNTYPYVLTAEKAPT